jgi:hypothetical protein
MVKKTIVFCWCLVVAVLLIVPAADAETETFDKTYDVTTGTRFQILNRDGSIEISGWSQDRIKIHAVKKTRWGGKLENVTIEVSPGADFRVETIHLVRNPKVSVSYDIKVPIKGILKSVQTSNGAVDLEGTRGDTEVSTSNGTIEIEGSQGNIDASTSNGSIEIEEVKGYVSARTSNGSISVEETTGIVALETSNGTIDAEVREVTEKGTRMRTSNGAIKVEFDPVLNIDLEAKTSNGKISVEDLEVLVKEISKTALKGKLGAGGNTVSCRTSNGVIELRRLK